MTENLPAKLKNVNEFGNTSLPKGKYDINYVINFCLILEDQLKKSAGLYHNNFTFSFSENIKKLRCNLEVERDQALNAGREIFCMYRCEICDNVEVVEKNLLHSFKCPVCHN